MSRVLRGRFRFFTVLALSAVVLTAGRPSAAREDREAILERQLQAATRRASSEYAGDLAKVASWALKNGLGERANELIARIEELDPDSKDLAKLRERAKEPSEAPSPKDLEKAEKTFVSRVEDAREDHAKNLFKLAKACMQVGLFTRAFDMVNDVVKMDPDHKLARSVLSYTWDSKSDSWITKWEKDMMRKYFLTEEGEGWIPKKDKRKWEKGLRPYKDQWITEEEERRLRSRNEYNPYRVESEHFVVSTNLGRKQAWHFALLLEDFYRQFFRVFIGFFDQKAGAKLLFNQADLKKKHKVYVYPSRKDYLLHVKAEHGNDELMRRSAGFYTERCKAHGPCSHFFWSDRLEDTYSTLYHEVAHQLFHETKEGKAGSSGNNWVVEGAAVYCETWEKVDGAWHPGQNTAAPEIRAARDFFEAESDWSLERFVAIGNEEFHEEPGRGLNYALAGALVHFFMHYDDELYKEDFVQFLRDYYEGKVREDSLVAAVNVADPDGEGALKVLERQLRQYLANLGKS